MASAFPISGFPARREASTRANAAVQLVGVIPKLRGEAIAGVHARSAAQGGLQRAMLRDECGGAAPRWDRVERLRKRHADHGADRVAGASRPACGLKLG